jgi:hypothetical protein
LIVAKKKYAVGPIIKNNCAQSGFYVFSGIFVGSSSANFTKPNLINCKEFDEANKGQEIGSLDVGSVHFEGFSSDLSKAYLRAYSFNDEDEAHFIAVDLKSMRGVEIKSLLDVLIK